MKTLLSYKKAYLNAKTQKGKTSIFNKAILNLNENDKNRFIKWHLYNDVAKTVDEFPTIHKEGFMNDEIETLLLKYPKLNRDKFENALRGITCIVREGKAILYHCDIEKAILCGIEKRDLYNFEWD
jgi:hypothetical protein